MHIIKILVVAALIAKADIIDKFKYAINAILYVVHVKLSKFV